MADNQNSSGAAGTAPLRTPALNPAQFQQEVAAEIGIDLAGLQSKEAAYRAWERDTHSTRRRGS